MSDIIVEQLWLRYTRADGSTASGLQFACDPYRPIVESARPESITLSGYRAQHAIAAWRTHSIVLDVTAAAGHESFLAEFWYAPQRELSLDGSTWLECTMPEGAQPLAFTADNITLPEYTFVLIEAQALGGP